MTIAMYPGRFDPVSNGHMDIIKRAGRIYEEVIVAPAQSSSTLFTTEERVELIELVTADMPNVRVASFSVLAVEAAREVGANVLVRGLRAITDFTTEFDMALMNRSMAPEIESAFLMTSVERLYVSASRIRELAGFGRDVSDLVHPAVWEALQTKFPSS